MIWLALLLWLIAAPAFAQSSKVHDLATNTTNPLPAGSCLYVDQNSVDTKLCSNWATAIGALLPSLSNLTATALPSGFTLPSPILTGTVAGANTIPYSILSQAAQRTILGNATTGTANITAGWTVSGDSSKVATTTGTLTNGHCVDIDSVGNFVDAGTACAAGGGGGSVTSVGVSVPAASIFGVGSSPITTAGTISLTTTGTSGGIPYFSSGTQLSTSAQMPANHAITGGGAGVSPKDSKVTITVPATGSTLTVADGKTATFNATTTFGGTDSKTVNFNAGLTFAGVDGTTQTFQATDTILGRATTDTMTNKTYDTAGTGNVFKIAGAQLTAISGTGATVALTAAPTFTGLLTGATGLFVVTPDTAGQKLEIQSLASPLNYGNTHAAFVLQKKDTLSAALNDLFPAAVFDMRSTGDGVVNAGSHTSSSIWMGLQGSFTKSGDGSGQVFTAIGNLGAVGATGYNELGLFQGTGYTSSANGTVSGIELQVSDCSLPSAGVCNGPNQVTGSIMRMQKQNADRTRVSIAYWATNEGTVAPDAILATKATHQWVKGVDFSGAVFTSGVALAMPNNTSISATNNAGNALYTGIFLDASDHWRLAFGNHAVYFDYPPVLPGYTVATLPAGTVGMVAYVTNAVACTFLAGVTGGGSVVCPVFYDGTSWKGG